MPHGAHGAHGVNLMKLSHLLSHISQYPLYGQHVKIKAKEGNHYARQMDVKGFWYTSTRR